MMELANKKNVKVISLVIAAIFIVGLFVLGYSQSGLERSVAGNPSESGIGKVNFNDLVQVAPGVDEARKTLQDEATANQKEYEEKSKKMNDEEKAKLQGEYRKKLQDKEGELIKPITETINKAIAAVGKTKGLAIVVDRNTVLYGGLDITQDVAKQLEKEKGKTTK